ncbi:MAG: Holliday junction resolvase RuvX [Patescibacteria group bacterium]|jgi:putative Holliday junction resolvase
MKILGIDWGEKRLGLAISQDEAWAFPWKILEIQSFTQGIEMLANIVEEQKIEKVVVGMPIGMDGKDTKQTSRVREVVADLGHVLNMPIEMIDERLTSEAAKKLQFESGKTTKNIDAQAATQILQTFLDQRKK